MDPAVGTLKRVVNIVRASYFQMPTSECPDPEFERILLGMTDEAEELLAAMTALAVTLLQALPEDAATSLFREFDEIA